MINHAAKAVRLGSERPAGLMMPGLAAAVAGRIARTVEPAGVENGDAHGIDHGLQDGVHDRLLREFVVVYGYYLRRFALQHKCRFAI